MGKPKRSGWQQDAIGKLEAELAEVESRLAGWRELTQRREVLQKTIASLKWLGAEADPPGAQARFNPMGQGVGSDPLLWEKVRDAMNTSRVPKTPGEIATLLHKSGRTAREIIRQAMKRKKDVFEQVDDGRYALVEWRDLDERKILEVS